tara:strand:+ start:364 stop:513 length:150 start_codon:yes stop_codon:yes gene_type:complete
MCKTPGACGREAAARLHFFGILEKCKSVWKIPDLQMVGAARIELATPPV